jgi:DNA repair protein RadC
MLQSIQSLFAVSEVELVYRSKVKPADRRFITNSGTAYDIMMNVWDMNKIELVEQSYVILLDRNCACLGVSNLSTGGVSACIVDPKIVFALAIKAKTSGFILVHNHPSGNLKPSQADIAVTEKIIAGGKFLDVTLWDHLIVTADSYYSFADEGMIPRNNF